MKRKLAIFGLAGVLLFSGISVSAATNGCGHPSTTTYYATENRNPKTCREHENCTKYEVHSIKAVVCHYCFVTIYEESKLTDSYYHTSQ